MLHVWLSPLLVFLFAVIVGFYLVVRSKGGRGVRSEGRTVTHQPRPEEDLPPGM